MRALSVPTIILLFVAYLIALYGLVLVLTIWPDRDKRLAWITSTWNTLFSVVMLGSLAFLYQQNQRNEGGKLQARKTHLELQVQLSKLLIEELSVDKRLLDERFFANGRFDLAPVASKQALQFSFWTSISNTGELKQIDNFEQLKEISSAYASLDQTKKWEDMLLNSLFSSSLSFNYPNGTNIPASLVIYNDYYRTLQPAREAVDKAIEQAASLNDQASRTLLQEFGSR